MNSISLWVVFGFFVLAWITPLVIILHYRLRNVEARYEEIRNALMDSPDGDLTAARHYLQLFTRTNVTSELGSAAIKRHIREHFLQFHGWENYAVPSLLLALFSAGALYFMWCWVSQSFLGGSPFGSIDKIVTKEVAFALAGAYVWSLYELSVRKRTGDLTPDELYEVAIRYVAALPIGHIGTLLSLDSVDAGFAFALSAVPLRDLRRIVRKRAFEKMKEEDTSRKEPLRAGYLGEVVDGLSPDSLARLEELQIVTFTDLAYADPIRIMVKTGFSLRHIIQWMDHAMLGIYAFDHKKKLGENAVVCSLDAKEFYDTHYKNPQVINCPTVISLSANVAVSDVLLGEIFGRVSIDPQVLFLERLWYTGYLGKRPELPPCPFHTTPKVAAAGAP